MRRPTTCSLNIAEFVYIKTNVAIDLGSRETVSIGTGIPSDLGSLGAARWRRSTARWPTSTRSSSPSGADQDRDHLGDQLGEDRDQQPGELDRRHDRCAAAVGPEGRRGGRTANVKSQLQSVTGSLSVDSLIDPLIAQIINQVPEGPLRDLVGKLVEPVKKELAAYFKDTINEP